jgi:hypothetical protein
MRDGMVQGPSGEIDNESDAYIHSISFCHMGYALALRYCISYYISCRPDRQGLDDSDKAVQIGFWTPNCSARFW